MWTNPSGRFAYEAASAATLRALSAALRAGQLVPPFSGFAFSKIGACPPALTQELQRLSAEGMAPVHLALLLETAAEVQEARLADGSRTELVWTGPESAVSHSRDTAAVVDELFGAARHHVTISTFTIQNAERVFEPLAARLDQVTELSARLFVHVGRTRNDTRDESVLLREFADRLRADWPGKRRPDAYYDPRTLSRDEDVRASWHAKCVLVDDEVALVTSANFTEWAQQRNVEAGVLVRSRAFVCQLRAQFDLLVQSNQVRRLPGF